MVAQVVTEAPARAERLGGIKRVAEVRTAPRIGAAESVLYITDGCTFALPAIGLCYSNAVSTPKTGVGLGNIAAAVPPFALYGGVRCWAGPDSDYQERARNILEWSEDRAIEQRLAAWATTNGTSVTGGSITGAIAAVDNALDVNYVGQGVILMNRGDAVRAASAFAITYGIDGAYTVNGTPVVASGAVPAGTVLGVGAVTILKSNVEAIDTIAPQSNTEWSVAEAVYAVLVDCNYAVKAATS